MIVPRGRLETFSALPSHRNKQNQWVMSQTDADTLEDGSKEISLFVNAEMRICAATRRLGAWCVDPALPKETRGLDHAPKSVQELLKSLSYRNSP
jgi:hypothetical protein